nr:MAG TPA: hypothetical protein [Caudoviricetes sp.]
MSTGWPQIAQCVPHVAAACQSSCLTLIPPHVMTLVYQPRVSSWVGTGSGGTGTTFQNPSYRRTEN